MISGILKLITLIILVLVVSGCEEQNVLSEFTSSGKKISNDQKIENKISHYLFCINTTSEILLNSAEHYYKWIGRDQPPKKGQKDINAPIQMKQFLFESCRDGIKKGASAPPKIEALETAANNYLEAINAFEPFYTKVYDYYEQKDYEDDDMQKGIEMHPKIITAFKTINDADLVLRDAFNTVREELDSRLLEKLKNEGQELAYKHRVLMRETKALIDLTDMPENLDLKAFTAQLDKVIELSDFIENYHPTEKETKPYSVVGTWKSAYEHQINSTKELITAAKELKRRKRDTKQWTNSERNSMFPDQVEGHPAKVIKAYNGMVGSNNALKWQ